MKSAAARDRCGTGAFGIYLALSMLFFGRGLAGHFTTRHLGKAVGDPALVAAGGVLIYRFTPATLGPWRHLRPLDLECRVDEARFDALLDAVDRYVQSGADLAKLSPQRLEHAGLIRDDWLGGPSILISSGLWAESHPDGTVDVGTLGSRGALVSLASGYRADALKVRATPIVTAENVSGDDELELMVMTFDRGGLARATRQARVFASSGSAPATSPDTRVDRRTPSSAPR